jgi:hypothetical protein
VDRRLLLNYDDPESRYYRRPFLRLLECYVLWSAGELTPELAASLEDLTPELRRVYDTDGTWQEIVEHEMDFTEALPTALRAMWERNQAAAADHDDDIDPEEWARHVVDSNFV